MVHWKIENEELIPVMTTLSLALEAIIQLVKWRCACERRSTNLCQCRKAGLLCTDPRSCSDNDHGCVRINNANATIMTVILRMKKKMMMMMCNRIIEGLILRKFTSYCVFLVQPRFHARSRVHLIISSCH